MINRQAHTPPCAPHASPISTPAPRLHHWRFGRRRPTAHRFQIYRSDEWLYQRLSLPGRLSTLRRPTAQGPHGRDMPFGGHVQRTDAHGHEKHVEAHPARMQSECHILHSQCHRTFAVPATASRLFYACVETYFQSFERSHTHGTVSVSVNVKGIHRHSPGAPPRPC